MLTPCFLIVIKLIAFVSFSFHSMVVVIALMIFKFCLKQLLLLSVLRFVVVVIAWKPFLLLVRLFDFF